MNSAIFDALASIDITNLLRRSATILAEALSADHVLVQDFAAVDTGSRFSASIGWDRATTVELGKLLGALSQQTATGALDDITPAGSQPQGSLHTPSPALLAQYNLATAMLVSVPCRGGSLAVLVGRAGPGPAFGAAEAGFLRASVNMLGMTVEHEHADLVHSRNMQRVLQAKHQWETTLDALPQLMCLIDRNGCVIRANRTLERWGLGDVTSVRGKQVHEIVHPGCRDLNCTLQANFESLWQQLEDTGFVECEYHDTVTGHDMHCSMHRGGKSPYQDGNEDDGYAFMVFEDISQEKQAERVLQNCNLELEQRLQERTLELIKANAMLQSEIQGHVHDKGALRESQERYVCLVETMLTGLFVVQDDRIVFSNNRFAEIFGYTQKETIGLDIRQLFPPIDPGTDPGGYDANQDPGWVFDVRVVSGVTRDGEKIWLQRSLARVDCQRNSMINGNVMDITELKKTEDALRQSRSELQRVSEKILLAQELERKRIAADLHDSIGGSITAIKLGMEKTMLDYQGVLPESNQVYFQNTIKKLSSTINEVRNISMNLRPSMLDDLGLLATLSWFIREFNSLFPEITVALQTDVEEGVLSDSLKVVIFRVIQEALNNISKHAQASHVSIGLLRAGDKLSLSVQDDGRGFSLDSVHAGTGYGLSSMCERVKLVDGDLVIESTPGAGVLIHAVWPVGR